MRRQLELERQPAEMPPLPEAAPAQLLRLPTWAIAHDIAGGVRGIVQLCTLVETQADQVPPELARQLGAIAQRARRLQRFIRDLQELERPRVRLEPAPRCDPTQVVREVMAGMEPELLALRPRLHLGHLPLLAVAPADLARLLANLLANALQHRSTLKPRLEVASRPMGGMVELSVSDNGPGIPEAMRARLFEPFFRLPSARAQPGSGLGLAICRAIVTSYGGRIWVEPAAGGGSCFCCTLPAAEP